MKYNFIDILLLLQLIACKECIDICNFYTELAGESLSMKLMNNNKKPRLLKIHLDLLYRTNQLNDLNFPLHKHKHTILDQILLTIIYKYFANVYYYSVNRLDQKIRYYIGLYQ